MFLDTNKRSTYKPRPSSGMNRPLRWLFLPKKDKGRQSFFRKQLDDPRRRTYSSSPFDRSRPTGSPPSKCRNERRLFDNFIGIQTGHLQAFLFSKYLILRDTLLIQHNRFKYEQHCAGGLTAAIRDSPGHLTDSRQAIAARRQGRQALFFGVRQGPRGGELAVDLSRRQKPTPQQKYAQEASRFLSFR